MALAAYLDASAAVKLIVREAESAALREALLGEARWVSSAVLGVELRRAGRRRADRAGVRRANDVLARVTLLPPDERVRDAAAEASPLELGSLDAIHLATAASLGDDLGVLVAYDERLLSAADGAGLPTLSPR